MTGTWTALKNPIPSGDGAGTMLLLSDGNVLAQGGGNSDTKSWYELTPDSSGSYTNGTWTTVASSNVGRLFYASDVLPDGSVYVLGGEYATDNKSGDTNTGEIFDPAADTWTTIASYPESNVGDGISETLPGGDILQGNEADGNLKIYDPSTNQWSAGPTLANSDSSSEEGWVKLADGSTLEYQLQGTKPQTAERLILGATEAQDKWVSAGSVPVALGSNGGNTGIVPELGPGVLLPSGKVFWIGASGHTAIYTPPGGSNTTGSWTQGPDILDDNNKLLGGFDAPAAVEPDGDVLFAAGIIDGVNFPGPMTIFEYDPNANKITEVTASGPGLSHPVFHSRMLVLPSGQVLFTNGSDSTLYAYNPSGSPSASWAPTVGAINWDGGNSFTLTGTQLNGLDEGAAYGDDAQMATNYPIIQLTNSSGTVKYATTSNWSSEWVATGSTPETTEFTLPSGFGSGVYTLSVIADGIASRSVVFVVGSSADDSVTLDTGSFFGLLPLVTVDLNGTTTDYFQFGISGVFVLTEGGYNSVGVRSTLAGTPTYIVGDALDTVYIEDANSSVQGILGPVTVTNPFSYSTLVINDIGDATSRSATLTSGSLTGLAPAPIYFQQNDLHYLDIYGGSGGNEFTVLGTPQNGSALGVHTYLSSGTGSDIVSVEGTTGPLSVDGVGGDDYVFVGDDGSLAGISGSVDVFNYGGADFLYVYDYNDTTQRYSTLNIGSLTWTAYAAPITWVASSTSTGGVTYLYDSGGSGSNIIDVDNSDDFYYNTYIAAGDGDDQVNVRATSGTLYVDGGGGINTVQVGSTMPTLGGTLAGIQGPVYVQDGSGVSYLYIDDGGDTTGRSATMGDGSLTWAYYAAPIYWTPTSSFDGGVCYLTVQGGSGGNTWTILNTSDFFYSTDLETGAGDDTVDVEGTTGRIGIDGDKGQDFVFVGSSGSLAGINGAVTAYNSYGSTYLYIDDSADTTGRSATMGDGSLTWASYAAPIYWTPSSTSTGGVTFLSVTGGSGGNTFTVANTSNFYYDTYLDSGAGSDVVDVEGTTGSLYLDGGGGFDSVVVGDDGSLAGISGAVDVYNYSGGTYLYVYDYNDTTQRYSTLNIGSLTWTAYAAPITWVASSTSTGGVTYLDYEGGSGSNIIDVDNSDDFYYYTYIESGNGDDQINVRATTGTLYVDGGGGINTVQVGSTMPTLGGTLAGIQGTVDVLDGSGAAYLYIDDGGDTTGRSATMDDGSLTWASYAAPIYWTPTSNSTGGVYYLTVQGGSGGNTWTILNTSNFFYSTDLETGTGDDIVHVEGTTGRIGIDGDSGQDFVYVGSSGSLAGINGAVTAYNSYGSTYLYIDDSADTTARSATMGDGSLTWASYAAPIYWTPSSTSTGGVTYLSVTGGSGGNTFTVADTSDFYYDTYLDSGAGSDVVDVEGTTGELYVNGGAGFDEVYVGSKGSTPGGTQANIHGVVDVYNAEGSTLLYVDDSGDSTGRTTTLGDGYLYDSGYGSTIEWTPTSTSTGGVIYLAVTSGSGNDTVDVDQTSQFYYDTYINTGPGNDAVNVKNTQGPLYLGNPAGADTVTIGSKAPATGGVLSGIDGLVYAGYTGSGKNSLILDDSGDATGRSPDLYSGEVTNFAPATIAYVTSQITSLTLDAGTGADTLTVSSLPTGVPTTFNGGPGANALIGPDAANTWTINGANAGSLDGTLAFTGIANLTGGTANDIFKFAAAGSISGKVDGGLGVNTLDYSGDGGSAATVDLATSAATRTGSFANIQALVGSSAADTLIGANVANTWTITGANAGTVGSFAFSGVENLTGNAVADDFKFANGAGVSGKIDGGAGVNTLDYSSYTTGVIVNLTTGTATGTGAVANIQDVVGTVANDQITGSSANNVISGGGGNDILNGGSGGIDTFILAATQGSATKITGGGTGDTIQAANIANTWTLTGLGAGNINGIAFTGISNLTGGTSTDVFKFAAGSVTGKVDGGLGVNTLDYSGDGGSAATVDLATSAATRTGGFANIQSLTGSTAVDTLIGANAANTWTITAANAGNINGVFSFTGIENLTGGTSTDAFEFSKGVGVTGKVDGGAGANSLGYSAYTTAVVVNLATLKATGTGGFANIQSLTGGSGVDTLIGANTANTWTITGANAGNINGVFSFTGVENLTGGTANDTFKFAAAGSVTGKVDGGLGLNTLDYSGDGGSAATVDLATSAATRTGSFANIQGLVGSTAADTLIGPNAANTWDITGANAGTVGTLSFKGVEDLTGGTSTDVFLFSNGAGVSGKIVGGGGSDWLDYSAYTTSVNVDLTADKATGTGGIANIANVRGGAGGDTLKGNSLGNILIGGAGNDTIIGGNGRSILIGGAGNDTVTGGSGDDIVIGGTTSYDSSSAANDQALSAILAEWQSADSYTTRISKIKAGVAGGYKFDFGTTVLDDGGTNKLTGGGGVNWFFEGAHDTITDLKPGEEVN